MFSAIELRQLLQQVEAASLDLDRALQQTHVLVHPGLCRIPERERTSGSPLDGVPGRLPLTKADSIHLERIHVSGALDEVRRSACGLSHVAGMDGTQTVSVCAVVRVTPGVIALIEGLNAVKSELRSRVSDALAEAKERDTEEPGTEAGIRHALDDLFKGYSRLMCYRQIPVLVAPERIRFFWSARQRASISKKAGEWAAEFEDRLARATRDAADAGREISESDRFRYQAIIDELMSLSASTPLALSRPKAPQLLANVRDQISIAMAHNRTVKPGRTNVWHRQVTGSVPLFYCGDKTVDIHWPPDFERVSEEQRVDELRPPGSPPSETRGARRKKRRDRRYRADDRDPGAVRVVKTLPFFQYEH